MARLLLLLLGGKPRHAGCGRSVVVNEIGRMNCERKNWIKLKVAPGGAINLNFGDPKWGGLDLIHESLLYTPYPVLISLLLNPLANWWNRKAQGTFKNKSFIYFQQFNILLGSFSLLFIPANNTSSQFKMEAFYSISKEYFSFLSISNLRTIFTQMPTRSFDQILDLVDLWKVLYKKERKLVFLIRLQIFTREYPESWTLVIWVSLSSSVIVGR